MYAQCTRSQKSFILFCLLAIPFLSGIGIDLYVPSLPIITSELQAPKSWVQFTISVYLLGSGIGQLVLGLLSDSCGRKKIILFSSMFYVIISFLCALSYNIYLLNLGRFLQGICLGGILATSRAIATDCFSNLSLNKMMSSFSISFAIGPIIGPFIGAYLQHIWNWQANFYFFALIGISIFISSFLIPETNRYRVKFHPSKIIKNIKYVSTHLIFLYSSIILSLVYSILVIFNVTGPFLIQTVLKYSVVDFGNIALILGFGYFLGGTLNRFLIHHFKPISISFLGIVISLTVSLLMVCLDAITAMNIYTVLFPTMVLFFFCGMNFSNILAKVISLFPQMAGITSAVYGLFISGICFLLTAFSTLLETNTQLPTSITYAILLTIALSLFLNCLKLEKRNAAREKNRH